MLAGLSPVCRRGTPKLQKLVPAAYGIMKFSKKHLKKECAKSEPAKQQMEEWIHGSDMWNSRKIQNCKTAALECHR